MRVMKNVCAIVLAAGKGSRMKSKNFNKVALEIGGKPMIVRSIENLKRAGISDIVVVVGFAKESVLKLLSSEILVAEQKKRLGNGHAVQKAAPKIPARSHAVLLIYGDDSYLHNPEIYEQLSKSFIDHKAAISLLTIEREDPTNFGRIIRGNNGHVLKIVEEKDTNEAEKKVKEINIGCYLFDKEFLLKYVGRIPKNPIKGEYYITDLIGMAVDLGLKVTAVKVSDMKWQGVNTKEELEKARELVKP